MKGIKITKKAIAVLLCTLMVFFSVSAAAETTWNWRDQNNTSGTTPVQHTHVYSEWEITKAPSCSETGERKRTCIYATETDANGNPTDVCGYVYTETMPIDPDAHVNGSVITSKEATCSSVGISTYSCEKCSATVTVYSETVAHTYDEDAWYTVEPVHEATLERAGSKTNRCTVCNETVKITIPVVHTYKDGGTVITAATCTEKGSMLQYCTECNKSKMVDIDVDPENHVYSGKALAIGDVDCENGGKGIVNCEACGKTVYVDISADDAHDYLQWEYVEATGDCLSGTNGSIKKKCKTCGEEFESKFWSGHALGSDARTHAATCSEYGYNKGTCTLCDRTDAEVVIPVDTEAHSWVEEVLIEPTCTDEGYVFRMCKYDSGHVEYTNIPANGHTYATDWNIIKEATCYEMGIRNNTCIVCNKLVSEYIDIDPDNHPIDESEWVVTEAPDCTEVGIEAAHCKYCVSDNDLVYREIPKHTGTLVEYSRTEATCCLEGKIVYDCYECGEDVIEVIPVDPDAHSPGTNYYITQNATCYEEGVLSKLCNYCMKPIIATTGEHAQKPIEKKSHIVGAWTITKEATCTQAGSKMRTCTADGCSYVEIVPIQASHRYEAWVVTSPANCTSQGERTRGCYNCDFTETEKFTGTHTPGEWIFVKGNCEIGGTVWQKCENCTKPIAEITVEAGKHVELTEVDDPDFIPTDSVCSRKAYKCAACKETLYVTSGHTFIKTANAVAPTCTEKGSTAGYYCPLCKREVTPKIIEATGHNFEYDEEGTKYCLNCTLYYVDGGTSDTCNHFCHNKGTIAKIMTKFFTFFWKILDRFSLEPKYQYCECGIAHYELEE